MGSGPEVQNLCGNEGMEIDNAEFAIWADIIYTMSYKDLSSSSGGKCCRLGTRTFFAFIRAMI